MILDKQELHKTKGLIVDIYTNESYKGCSNGGISEHHTRAILVGEGIPKLFGSDDFPRLKLNKGYIIGHVFAEPLEARMHEYMAGGAFIYSSDSRFSEAVQLISGGKIHGAVPIHDRKE